MRRVRPPFARTLGAILAEPSKWPLCAGTSPSGRRLQLWVIAGAEAWQFAKDRHDRYALLVAPPGEPVEAYDWSLLAGHDPIIVMPVGYFSEPDSLALATAILRDGSRRVLVWGRGEHYVRGYPEARALAAREAAA